MDRVLGGLRDRADLAVLLVVLAGVPFLPGGVPGGVVGTGLVAGAALALQAAGLILVYRSNRIVNFAQVQIGVVAAVLFRLMIEHEVLLRALGSVCPSCEALPSAGWLHARYWASIALALLAAMGLAWLVHRGVIARFATAPRLVLTVATIGLAQLLGSVQEALPYLFASTEQRRLDQVPRGIAAPPPGDVSLEWSPAVFRLPEILTVVVATIAIASVVLILRRSRIGIGIRAASENPARAGTLGINTGRVTGRVWVMAGALSGTAALLGAMSTPSPEAGELSIAGLIRILAVAIVARLTSIPVAAVAALAIGVFDRAVLWAAGQSGIADAVFTAVIALVLFAQRERPSRKEQELVDAWRASREVRPIPAQLRALPAVRRWTRMGVGAGAILVLGAPFVLTPTQTTVATTSIVYAMVGVSLLVLSGWAGQVSLGQFALAGIGGSVAALVSGRAGLPMPLALVLAIAAGALAAILVGLPALRMRGLHLAVTTLAIAVSVAALLDPDVLGGVLPERLDRPSFLGIHLDDVRSFYYAAVVVLGLVIAATIGMRKSRAGRALIAARDNDTAAQAFGVRVVRARLGAFAFSGGIAALAGAVFAYQQNGVRVADYSAEVSIVVFLMTVIGGVGSLAGPLLGAVYLGALTLTSVSPLVLFLATGGGVVALLLVLPGGLAQLWFDARDAVLRRIAQRARLEVPTLGVTGVRERVPLARPGREDVPERYALADQWGLPVSDGAS